MSGSASRSRLPLELSERHAGSNMRLDVQGLRAVAVLAVIAYHADSSWLSAGFVGVDVFFVISGFIISVMLAGRTERISLLRFYGSRAKRILPAYFFMLTVVCLVSAILLLPSDYDLFKSSLKSAALFTSNQYFSNFGSYFAPRADELPLLHTWSLAIEMQFYLFFPLVFLLLPRKWWLPFFAALAVVLFAWSGWHVLAGKQGVMYFSLLTRVPEFMLGAVVALSFWRREPSPRLSAMVGGLGALLLGLSFILVDKEYFPGLWSIMPSLATALIIAAGRGPVSSFLAYRPLVWIGALSYSLYLWHWPILAFMRYYTGQYELGSVWMFWFLATVFLLAWLSYRFIEVPSRMARGLRQRLPWWIFAACVVIVISSQGGRLNESVVAAVPIELTRYAEPELICHGTQIGDCKQGSKHVQPSVLVIGDSHAAQLNYFFDEIGTAQGLSYRVLTGSSCVPIPGFDVERLSGWAQDACRTQIKAVTGMMPMFDRIIVAGMWQYQMQSQEFAKSLQAFLVEASREGKQVVLLAQIPMFDTNVQRARRFSELGLPASLQPNKEWQGANRQVLELVRSIPSVHFVDYSSSAFFIEAPYQGGELIYQDNHHLNEVGARRYGRYVSSQVQSLFDQP